MSREAEPLADYLAVALADLCYIADQAKAGTLTTDAMQAAAKTFNNAASKLRRAAAAQGE